LTIFLSHRYTKRRKPGPSQRRRRTSKPLLAFEWPVPMPDSSASVQKEPRKLQNRTLRRKNKALLKLSNKPSGKLRLSLRVLCFV
jgi:hypothetical protein